ncbi:MAG: hypothetical protein ACUVRT_03660 [Armatimonadota bacterium]
MIFRFYRRIGLMAGLSLLLVNAASATRYLTRSFGPAMGTSTRSMAVPAHGVKPQPSPAR